jgi:hypothetical protein
LLLERILVLCFSIQKRDGNAMPGEKNVSMSFRGLPRFKMLLEAAATRENRSLTNMLETLLFAYCGEHGLSETVEPWNAPHNNKKGAKK